MGSMKLFEESLGMCTKGASTEKEFIHNFEILQKIQGFWKPELVFTNILWRA
jgi:hypothetical protein